MRDRLCEFLKMTRDGAGYQLPLVDRRVQECRVGIRDVRLVFDGYEFSHVLSIAQPFRVTRWHQEWTVVPGQPETVGPLLGFVGVSPVHAVAFDEGTVELWFPEGSLRVEPAAATADTWEYDYGGTRVSCTPGKGLSLISGDRGGPVRKRSRR